MLEHLYRNEEYRVHIKILYCFVTKIGNITLETDISGGLETATRGQRAYITSPHSDSYAALTMIFQYGITIPNHEHISIMGCTISTSRAYKILCIHL